MLPGRICQFQPFVSLACGLSSSSKLLQASSHSRGPIEKKQGLLKSRLGTGPFLFLLTTFYRWKQVTRPAQIQGMEMHFLSWWQELWQMRMQGSIWLGPQCTSSTKHPLYTLNAVVQIRWDGTCEVLIRDYVGSTQYVLPVIIIIFFCVCL